LSTRLARILRDMSATGLSWSDRAFLQALAPMAGA
jgi:hypothetical protein